MDRRDKGGGGHKQLGLAYILAQEDPHGPEKQDRSRDYMEHESRQIFLSSTKNTSNIPNFTKNIHTFTNRLETGIL